MLDDQVRDFSMTRCGCSAPEDTDNRSARSGNPRVSQRSGTQDAQYVEPLDMIAELRDDNAILMQSMRETHSLCTGGRRATASLLETD